MRTAFLCIFFIIWIRAAQIEIRATARSSISVGLNNPWINPQLALTKLQGAAICTPNVTSSAALEVTDFDLNSLLDNDTIIGIELSLSRRCSIVDGM